MRRLHRTFRRALEKDPKVGYCWCWCWCRVGVGGFFFLSHYFTKKKKRMSMLEMHLLCFWKDVKNFKTLKRSIYAF